MNRLVQLITEVLKAMPLAKRGIIKARKAFYAGAGYSGVHDPDYDLPPDAAFFNREGFEQLKRRRRFRVKGRGVYAEALTDLGGEPMTRLWDAVQFNTNEGLEAWLAHMGAQPSGVPGEFLLPGDLEEDRVWFRK